MGKHQQLQRMQEHNLPVPAFRVLTWAAWAARREAPVANLAFPLAVRSSYLDEDSTDSAQAGQYHTGLWVSAEQLPAAIDAVFASYPTTEGTEVILQEMVDPDYSGVLFAWRHSVWKGESIAGQGQALVSGQQTPDTFLLPRFGRDDLLLSRIIWPWPGAPLPARPANRALLQLSVLTQKLLALFPEGEGLDIEFAIQNGRLWLLQARPITTPEEAEEVLTTANHREILPPKPSHLMTAIISQAGEELFGYYQKADPKLPGRSFIWQSNGMPWINLSALLDCMVAWGLPTVLVCRSVGADDVYTVRARPWRMLAKLPVFLRLLRQQWGLRRRIHDWVKYQRGWQHWQREERRILWETEPVAAFDHWLRDFSGLYVELVTHMQNLTAAMSGPVQVLDKLGVLSRESVMLSQKSSSTDYLYAFQQLRSGALDQRDFLRRYGHRGFYESDIGQPRFFEYTAGQWEQLLGGTDVKLHTASVQKKKGTWRERLLQPVMRLVHLREWIRNVSMYLFWQFRRELKQEMEQRYGERFPFSAYTPEELRTVLEQHSTGDTPPPPGEERQSGWDMDTFLANGYGRRLPTQHLKGVGKGAPASTAIGIFPGEVTGTVWRVRAADFTEMTPPQAGKIILVADALDPGWVPFLSRVDGVIAYTGGLLSHASIMLREAGIPAITQCPRTLQLKTGDRIRMNGRTGSVERLVEKTKASSP